MSPLMMCVKIVAIRRTLLTLERCRRSSALGPDIADHLASSSARPMTLRDLHDDAAIII